MGRSSVFLRNGKTRITVLSGFLGGGKTTLLKRILACTEDLSSVAVIVNEFGDIGIDSLLLKDAGSSIIELAGGCICCSLRTGLKQALLEILNRFNPTRILIEASGVADPGAIRDALQDETLKAHMQIQEVVTVVEADAWADRENFGAFFLSQLREADLILLNKIDLLEQREVTRILKEIHDLIQNTRVVPTIFCNVDPEILLKSTMPKRTNDKADDFFHYFLGPGGKEAENLAHRVLGVGSHHHEAEEMGFVTFSFKSPELMDESSFMQFIRNLPWELFRVKGLVRFQDRTVMLNYVGGKAELADWDGEEETRLVFAGLRIDEQLMAKELRKCLEKLEKGSKATFSTLNQ